MPTNKQATSVQSARGGFSPGLQTEHMVIADDVVSISEAWPRAAIDKIESKSARAFAYAVRASLGRGPSRESEADHWRNQVRTSRELATAFGDGRIDRSRVAESVPGKALLAHADVLAHVDEKRWSMIRDVTPYTDGRVSVTARSMHQTYASANDPAIDKDVASLVERREQQRGSRIEFGVYTRHGSRDKTAWISPVNLRGVRAGEMQLARFPDAEAARLYLRDETKHAKLVERVEECKQALSITPGDVRNADNRDRVGDDYRHGEDATVERFRQEFGFRSVDLGKDGSQATLNATYDALHDLAHITGMKPRDLSLHGKLALSFGARGAPGQFTESARYSPKRHAILLAQEAGPGSLAHAWMRALDDHMRQRQNEKSASLRNATEFGTVARVLEQKTEAVRRSVRADAGRRPAWADRQELVARAFEAHVAERLAAEEQVNDFLVNVKPETEFKNDKAAAVYPYPTQEEVAKLSPAFDAELEHAREHLQAPEQNVALETTPAPHRERDTGPELSM